MVGPSRLMYLVKHPLPFCTKGVTAKMAARAPGLQGMTLRMLPDTISLNPTSKWIFRPWHNSSSSLPVLLTTSLSVSVVSLLLFSQCGPRGGWCGVPHLSNSCEFKMVSLVFEDECLMRLGVWGSSLQVYHVGNHGWLLFKGCRELSSPESGPLKRSGVNPWQTLCANRSINIERQV